MRVNNHCDRCDQSVLTRRLRYIYQDQKRTYRTSKIKIIYSEYLDLCRICFKEVIKFLEK